MTLRPRQPDDIDACVALLAGVHAASGYPMYWPVDPAKWLTSDNLLAAWVAEDERTVIGHVALRGAEDQTSAPAWAAATGLPPHQLGDVAKLFVAPSARGRGIGATLLSEACAEAHRRGLSPVLEVLDHDRAAIALYERAGWRRVASESIPWARAEGAPMLLHAYIAPPDELPAAT